MTFLKLVEAALARRLENATPCDTCDIATPDATPTPETVAVSQKSQAGPYPEAADTVAVSQVSQQGPQAGHGDLWRWREYFEERAAVRQYDGGLSRAEAEAGALDDLAQQWRSENPLPASPPMLRVKPENLVETVAALRASARGACYHCGEASPDTPVLADTGHVWLHRECWAPMNEKRQEEALQAVTRFLREGTLES